MSRILDKSFKYVPSHETDISKLFKKIRAEQKAKAEKTSDSVVEIKPRIKAKVA